MTRREPATQNLRGRFVTFVQYARLRPGSSLAGKRGRAVGATGWFTPVFGNSELEDKERYVFVWIFDV